MLNTRLQPDKTKAVDEKKLITVMRKDKPKEVRLMKALGYTDEQINLCFLAEASRLCDRYNARILHEHQVSTPILPVIH